MLFIYVWMDVEEQECLTFIYSAFPTLFLNEKTLTHAWLR